MDKPRIPADEARRLAALRRLKILDTPPEERFDRLTRLAQNILGVPIAVVSLVDEKRQWFKSRQGLDATETSRDISFCGHAILGRELFEIADATKDSRFADNPLVTAPPDIRFYAGVPLRLSTGETLGTLCVIDRVPRALDASQRRVLADLGTLASRELEAATIEDALGASAANEERFRLLLDETTDLILSLDYDGALVYANKALCSALGYTLEELRSMSLFSYLAPEARRRCARAMVETRKGKRPHVDVNPVFLSKCGVKVTTLGRVSRHAEPGMPPYARGIFRDVTAQTRVQRRLAAQFAATHALMQATTWREGLEGVMRGIARSLDIAVAAAWELDESGTELYCSDFWSADGKSTEFSRASRQARLKRGEGLAGRAWKDAKPYWVPDVTIDPNFPRAALARLEGLRMGAALPVILDGKVEGVFSFFDTETADSDDEILNLFSVIGAQMGEFLRRRRADAALQKSLKATADLRTALDASAIVVTTDAAGVITGVNDFYMKISGYSREELVGNTHKLVNSGVHPESFFKTLWDTIKAGRSYHGEICNRAKDGKLYWIDTTITPFLNESGRPFQYIAIQHDITARKALSADFEAQVEAIGKSLCVLEVDMDGTILSANANFLKAMGYALDEIKGKNRSIFRAADAPSDEEFWSRIRRGEHQFRESQRVAKDGGVVWLQASINPIFGLDGKPYKVVTYAIDITARKLAEARAAEASARLQSVLDNASQISIIATDPAGRIIVFNKGAENLLGYAAAEIMGKTPELIHSREEVESRGRLLSMECGREIRGFDVFVEAARGGGFDAREWTYVRKDGSRFPVNLTVTALHDAEGGVNGFLGIAVDISESRRAREELAKARDAALDLAKAKAEFLANMSHEIRTPMNAVIGMTGLLMDTAMTPQQREFAETIRNAGESLLEIIGDILDFSKMEAGSMPLEMLDFSPRTVAEEVAMLFAGRAQGKGLEIAAVVDDGLPARLRGDAGRLRQILSNFVSNAVKFTEKGEVTVRARLMSRSAEEVRVRFETADTGIGIDDAVKKKLFTAFTQADASTTRRYGGTGLGLAISKKLVEMMKGEIGVDSRPGTGSTFWFEIVLPIGQPVATEEAADVAGARVLIVDDNATNREILLHQTASWRMRPQAVASAPDALAALRAAAAARDPFHLALIDMQMPGMSGEDLAREVKGDSGLSDLRMIRLSSMSMSHDRAALVKLGFDGALVKPVRKSSLYDAVVEVLSRRPAAARPAAPAAAAAPEDSLAGLRILIAEDNPINQKVAALQLQKLGGRTDTVANGREAVAAVRAIPYDLILMDCQMPEMDGFEATRAIRREQAGGARRTVIIAMTANALAGDRERCLEAGMDDYVPKPVRIEELAAAIGRWYKTIDPGPLSDLRELGDEKALAELIDSFLKDSRAKVQLLRDAARAGDGAAVRHAAHSLKGAAGTLGAAGVQRLAAELEKLGREGRLEGAAALVESLDNELERAVKKLKAAPGK